MAVIPASEVRNLFTKALIALYIERVKTSGFLRSFFTVKETISRFVSIEVIRGTEKVAVDVLRGTKGNRRTFTRGTEKIIDPPYYRQYFDLHAMSAYDNVFGVEGNVSDTSFALLLERTREQMNMLIDEIERAYELQCAQIFDTGIVELKNGDNIDYLRKAQSLIDKTTGGSPEPWTTGTVDPLKHLREGAKFIREVGKAQSGIYNVIMGELAIDALLSNDTFQKKSDLKDIDLNLIHQPIRESHGGTLHGRVSIGSYKANIWTYPEIYENETGDKVPYVDPKKVIVLPDMPKFHLSFAGIPTLQDGKPKAVKGQYVFKEFIDERTANVDYDVQSAGVAIPTAVDQIWTAKVVA